MLRFDKAMYLSFLFKSILSVRLSNSCLRIRCFTIFRMYKYSIHFLFYTFIEFMILLYTFLVISLAQYKEYMIFLISFNKFSDKLSAFTYASTIGNL